VIPAIIIKTAGQTTVAHAYNSNYLRDRDEEEHGLRLDQAKS
jgi:hypothetical protein